MIVRPAGGAGIRLGAFAGLMVLAAWRYAGIETPAPTIRVLALVLLTICAGVALMLVGPRPGRSAPSRRRGAIVRAGVISVLLVSVSLTAGVPARLLVPSGWGTLARDLNRGVAPLATTIWPYAGTNPWTRVDILLGLGIGCAAAAALGCVAIPSGDRSPGVRSGLRRLGALGLLLAIYVVGVLDANGGSAGAEGVLLLGLLVAWLWLPELGPTRRGAVFAWLAAAGALGAGMMGALGGSRPWFDYRGWDLLGSPPARTAFSWDQTYGPIPWSRSNRPMFTVRSPAPGRWKVTTLDRFDGLRFLRSGTDAGSNEDLPLPLDERWYRFATFTVAGLSSRQLPAEQGTTAGVQLDRHLAYGQDGTVSTLGRPLRGGDTYTVLSYVPAPSPAQLRAAPRAFPASYLRYTAFDLPTRIQSGLRVSADRSAPGQFWTRSTVGAAAPGHPLPAGARRRILASPYAPMYRLAQRLAVGPRSTYDVAVATEHYLKTNYAYSEQSPRRRYPLESFLFDDRLGYCQQFSGAMALMLRMDGIPARVAAGFLTGTYDRATKTYRVRALDAHSWVEVYFTGVGWVPFDPTPPRTVGLVQRPVYASSSAANPAQAIAATVGSPPVARRAAPAPVHHRSRAPVPLAVRLALWALAGLSLLAVAIGWLTGNRRLRRSLRNDGELVTQELVNALRSLGYAVPATATLAQIERLVALHGGPEAARYVALLGAQRYGRGGGGARATLRDRRRLRLGMTAHLGFDVRLRGHWALPPGTLAWRLRGAVQLPGAGGP
jgi:transglutaminase-like putative cysteine protease